MSDYRKALGQFPTGVAIITAKGEGNKCIGRTINSFVSISLSPPLIGWFLGENSEARPIFESCAGFAINFLSKEQEQIAMDLAKRGKFDLGHYDVEFSTDGIPALKNTLASFICSTHDQITVGDHVMFVGKVINFENGTLAEAEPLIFHRGRFGLETSRHVSM